ncbi:hypothetical protein PPUJ20005_38510 [Pseudomonas putida]|nr:hypothetical protein PPUJ20005_38510 [Pseudomonas putida]
MKCRPTCKIGNEKDTPPRVVASQTDTKLPDSPSRHLGHWDDWKDFLEQKPNTCVSKRSI